MDLGFTSEDLAPLAPEQKGAILRALFVALIADGRPTAEEQQRFALELGHLPWGKDPREVQAGIKELLGRLSASTRDDRMAFLRETAENIPGAELREKVVYSMARIVSADKQVSEAEKATLAAFVDAFALTPEQMARIGARLKA